MHLTKFFLKEQQIKIKLIKIYSAIKNGEVTNNIKTKVISTLNFQFYEISQLAKIGFHGFM